MTTEPVNPTDILDDPNIRRLTERRVTIKNTTFEVGKLLPFEAIEVFEVLRVPVLNRLATMTEMDTRALTIALMNLPRDTMKEAAPLLFEQVKFTNAKYKTPTSVTGNENAALEGLEPYVYYELFMRSVVVNFLESLRDILSRIPPELLEENSPQ